MKPTDFSKYLTDFLSAYLPHERGSSPNTILAYRDTFILLMAFMCQVKHIKAEKLCMKSVTKIVIVEFLDWLQTERKNSATTRNHRLAVLHSFFKYVQYKDPDNLLSYQEILSVKKKKARNGTLNYLTVDGIRLLLEQPDTTTKKGYRDLALLSLMYDSGSRVQEIIDLTPSNIRLETPCTIQITGKGNKSRIVPLLQKQMVILQKYLIDFKLYEPKAKQYPLFYNSRYEKLTRAGVTYILLKYANEARKKNPELIPSKISCHSLRCSKAMHLLQAGVNLVYIRDILGHSSVQTTELYARADSRQKREAIEMAYADIVPKEKPKWENNENLLDWLNSL